MNDTNIEIGSIWVRDGKKYKVINNCYMATYNTIIIHLVPVSDNIVFADDCIVRAKRDFLKDFTPYKPVYKYQYAWKHGGYNFFNAVTAHLSEEEAAELISKYPKCCHQKIEASKIEV